MGGYRVKDDKHILRAGDSINDAVNLWGSGNTAVYHAWLEFDAFSTYGEPARLAYENIRTEALTALQAAQESLIAVREALYQVATGYQRAEADAGHQVRRIRPELREPF